MSLKWTPSGNFANYYAVYTASMACNLAAGVSIKGSARLDQDGGAFNPVATSACGPTTFTCYMSKETQQEFLVGFPLSLKVTYTLTLSSGTWAPNPLDPAQTFCKGAGTPVGVCTHTITTDPPIASSSSWS